MTPSLHVATRKGLFTVAKGGDGHWDIANTDFIGDNVSISLHDAKSGTTFAALDHGHFGVKLHRREKGGDWQEIATPEYPEKPEGHEEHDMWGRPIPWSIVQVWALETGGADEPGTLWCGTIPGGVFKSSDHGTSWQMMRSLWDEPKRQKWMGGGMDLPGVHSILVDPRNSQHVTLGVSIGGLWHTDDGGATWQQRGEGMRAEYVPEDLVHDPIAQDVHRLAQCRADPDRIWVQHHNGMFISGDAGRTFKEITDVKPSVFGFPCVVHPQDPDTAWFVPGIKDEKRIPVDGRLVLTRTRDGGKSFEILSNGLPQRHAYDLVYRHALALDDAGTRLAMGSTTGGLWISEDQGDTWSSVSQNLPPVYSVRFF